ncbi:AAA family ATPase [Clostridium sp.]|uniref:AAA family ATPase n=1 Tax=Clostridium sp. TaxID=1506 RepID=UPI0025B953BA|nr:AAA family ATPase [Clostridium sp.]
MDKINVMLIDVDEKYLIPIELKLIEMLGDKINLSVITDLEYLNNYFNLPRKIDILVIRESLYNMDFQKHNIVNTFILSENLQEQEATQNLNVHVIYKYTSVKEIYNEIINKSVMEVTNEKKQTKVIMTYSPAGGVGKTTISMGLAKVLNNSYKKVIYINTESIQSFNFLLDSSEYCQLGFEKYISNNDENIMAYLNEAIGCNGFDYLLPFKQSLSALNISLNNFKYLIEKIKESGLYEYIIVDTSNELTSEKSMLMGYCDKVIILTTQDESSVVKLNSLKYNIDCSNENKFITICNKYKEDKENYLIKDEIITGCNVSEYIEFISDTKITPSILAKKKSFSKLAYMIS